MKKLEFKVFEGTPPLILKHLNEVNSLKKSENQNKEREIIELTYTQYHETMVLFYYKNLSTIKPNCKIYATFQTKLNNLHIENSCCKSIEDMPLDTKITLNPFFSNNVLLDGAVLYYFKESIVGAMKNKTFRFRSLIEKEDFYKSFIEVPQPFVFLPQPELYDVRTFMDNVYKNGYKLSIMQFIGESYTVYLVDPLTAKHLGLDFFLQEFLKESISSLYLGFIFQIEQGC